MESIDTTDNMKLDVTEVEQVTNHKYVQQTKTMEKRTIQEVLIKIKGWSVLESTEKSFWTDNFTWKERKVTSVSYQQ